MANPVLPFVPPVSGHASLLPLLTRSVALRRTFFFFQNPPSRRRKPKRGRRHHNGSPPKRRLRRNAPLGARGRAREQWALRAWADGLFGGLIYYDIGSSGKKPRESRSPLAVKVLHVFVTPPFSRIPSRKNKLAKKKYFRADEQGEFFCACIGPLIHGGEKRQESQDCYQIQRAHEDKRRCWFARKKISVFSLLQSLALKAVL